MYINNIQELMENLNMQAQLVKEKLKRLIKNDLQLFSLKIYNINYKYSNLEVKFSFF